jgi:hypothetical protein
MVMKNKEWALAWLAEMDRLAKNPESVLQGEWINKQKAIEMLLEAKNILEIELENK